MKTCGYALAVLSLISGKAFAADPQAAVIVTPPPATAALATPSANAASTPTTTTPEIPTPEASSPTTSESPAMTISPSQVTLTATCENYEGRLRPLENQIVVTGSMIPFVPILADLVGDVAGAGLNALSTAIANASKAKAVGAEGTASFEFYTFTGGAGIVSPTIGENAPYGCLSLTMSPGHTNYPQGIANWPLHGFDATSDGELTYNGVVVTDDDIRERVIRSFKITPEPTLIVEVEIHRLRDGFFLEPVYISYKKAFKAIRTKKPLRAELQLTFATPSSTPTGTVFALTRIALPAMKPGDIWWKDQLGVRSGLLPYRPHDGSLETVEAKLTSISVVTQAREQAAVDYAKMIQAVGLVPIAQNNEITCQESGCPSWLKKTGEYYSINGKVVNSIYDVVDWARTHPASLGAAGNKNFKAAQDDRQAKLALIQQESFRLQAQLGQPFKSIEIEDKSKSDEDDNDDEIRLRTDMATGSASVTARFVVIKDENKFGMAIAAALAKQQQPVADALKAAVYTPQVTWSQTQSDYVLAMAKVDEAQLAYDTALPTGDAVAASAAKVSLVTSQADANLKAAAASKPLPFPSLGR